MTKKSSEDLQMHFRGKSTTKKWGKLTVFLNVDQFSNRPATKTATTTKQKQSLLSKTVILHGVLKTIRTDKDTAFKNRKLCQKFDIEFLLYHCN